MATLTNTTEQPIDLGGGFVVAPGGSVDVPAQVAGSAYAQRRLRAGHLTEGEDMRTKIAKAGRAELLDIILAHYPEDVTAEDFDGITVKDKDGKDGLRTIALRVLFSDF